MSKKASSFLTMSTFCSVSWKARFQSKPSSSGQMEASAGQVVAAEAMDVADMDVKNDSIELRQKFFDIPALAHAQKEAAMFQNECKNESYC